MSTDNQASYTYFPPTTDRQGNEVSPEDRKRWIKRQVFAGPAVIFDVDKIGRIVGVETIGEADWRNGLISLAMRGEVQLGHPKRRVRLRGCHEPAFHKGGYRHLGTDNGLPGASGAQQKGKAMTKQSGAPVVVTTEHRGVFFGYIDGNRDGATVELRDAQMCVYWASSVRGVLGLAATGPDAKCRVTPPVPSITLHKVTAVMGASDEAVKAWLAQPWSRS